MDVQCPNCNTLYEVSETRLREGSPTLKCSKCDHLFRVESGATLSRETQQRWMLREATTGDIRYFTTFEVLRDWIQSGKVGKADEISRTGDKWIELGAVRELDPVFGEDTVRTQRNDVSPNEPRAGRARSQSPGQLNERTEPLRATPAESSPTPSSQRSESPPQSSRNRRSRQPQSQNRAPEAGMGREPGSATLRAVEAEFGRRNWTGIIIGVAASVLVVGMVLLYLFGGSFFGTSSTTTINSSVMQARDIATRTLGRATQQAAQALDTRRATKRARDAATNAVHNIAEAAGDRAEQAAQKARRQRAAQRRNQQPSFSTVLDRANSALENGATGRAKRLFEQAFRHKSSHPAALSGLGWVQLARDNPAKAAEYFRRAIGQNPSYGDALIGLGKAERLLGQRQKAIEAYQTYLDSHPNGPKSSIAKYQLRKLKD